MTSLAFGNHIAGGKGCNYRNTDVADLVQASSLNGVKVVDNGGLRQGLRVGRSGLKTIDKELDEGVHIMISSWSKNLHRRCSSRGIASLLPLLQNRLISRSADGPHSGRGYTSRAQKGLRLKTGGSG
jgi:hypothetical protein